MKTKKKRSKARKRKISKKPKKKILSKKKKTSSKTPTKLKKIILKKATKIKPAKKLGKVSTGITGFDKMIKGGFESESINLVSGGSGSGKTSPDFYEIPSQ